jgi:hypothetical protein
MEKNSKDLSTDANTLKQFLSFILWLGGSAGSIGLVLTAFGFFVEHAYLESLGVPRTVFEATPTEYIVSGGKFLVGLIPLTLTGSMQFVLNCWWAAVPMALYAGLFTLKKWTHEIRLPIFTALYAVWFSIILLHFENDAEPSSMFNLPAKGAVAIFAFTTIAGVAYFYWEVINAKRRKQKQAGFDWIPYFHALHIPLLLILICAILALPYLRGRYAIKRTYPTVEFLGSDRVYFDELASDSSLIDDRELYGITWQLMEIGEEKAILKIMESSQVYIVPKDRITNFKIIK